MSWGDIAGSVEADDEWRIADAVDWQLQRLVRSSYAVLRCLVLETSAKSQSELYITHSETSIQPMPISMRKSLNELPGSNSCVQNTLQFVRDTLRWCNKDCVAVVYMWSHENMYKSYHWLVIQWASDFSAGEASRSTESRQCDVLLQTEVGRCRDVLTRCDSVDSLP